MKRKIKKLSTIFIISSSFTLIFISALFFTESHIQLRKLGNFAIRVDESNNEQISSDLFLEITRKTATVFSEAFDKAGYLTNILSYMAYEKISDVNNVSIHKNNQIKLEKYKNRDYFVYSSDKNFQAYYWGNDREVPESVTNQINSLTGMYNLFKDIYESRNLYRLVWVLSKDDYIFAYPDIKEYYQNIPNRSVYQDYYTTFRKKVKDVHPVSWHYYVIYSPYKDLSDTVVLSVKSPVYNDKNELIAYVGIDIDFQKLSDQMTNNQLFIKDSRNLDNRIMKGFTFIIGEKGNIITFPKSYADLFSVPEDSFFLEHYLQRNTVKLSDSTNPEVKAFASDIQKKDSGISTLTLQGADYICSFAKIKETAWTLGFVVEQKSLLRSAAKTKDMMVASSNKMLRSFILISLFFILFSLFILIFSFKRFFLKPIQRIIAGIKKLGSGDFNINIKEEGADEIVELSSAFNFLGKELRDYIENLKREISARQAIETEIQIAEKIQRSVLPNVSEIPANGYFELAARLDPAKNISGDFYDAFYLNENKLAVLIADVSGKGLPAAFFMAMSKVIIKNYCSPEYDNPGLVLEKANNALCMDNKSQMFATAFLCFYDFQTGLITYANAGHHSSILISKNEIIREEPSKDMALGIFEGMKYQIGKKQLNLGETLVLCTDGAFEAVSPNDEEYGEDRLEKLILNNKDLSSEDLCNFIVDDVEKYEAGSRFDDITVLVLRRLK